MVDGSSVGAGILAGLEGDQFFKLDMYFYCE